MGESRDAKDIDAGSERRKEFNECLDAIIEEARTTQPSELFYRQKARELQDICPAECIAALTRRLQKAGWDEQDVLVQLLAQFSGVEHVSFLQEFVGREAFMPRTGMKILEIFNKSDVIIEPGVAGALLDYDNFARRISRALMEDSVDDDLAAQFCACAPKQRDGIATQLLEDHGALCSPFLARVCSVDKKAGERILAMLEACAGETGFRVMEAMYAAEGRKDILKRMKKAARALAQKGITVDLPKPAAQAAPVFKSAGPAPARAFASIIDPEGCRMLFIIKPVSTQESKIFQIMTSDSRGISMIDVVAAYRGETSQLIKKLLNDTKSDFREIDVGRCVALAMEAVGLSREQGLIVPATVAQIEAHFHKAAGNKPAAAIYGLISADDIARLDPAPDTAALVASLGLEFWFIAAPEGRACWEKIAQSAPDDAGLQELLDTLAAEERSSFFTPARKQAFRRRLEEFAWILHEKGSVDQAHAALAAALNLAAPGHDPAADPFCARMIDRAFEIFRRSLEEKARTSGTSAKNG